VRVFVAASLGSREILGGGEGRQGEGSGWARALLFDGDTDLMDGIELTAVLELELALVVLDRDLPGARAEYARKRLGAPHGGIARIVVGRGEIVGRFAGSCLPCETSVFKFLLVDRLHEFERVGVAVTLNSDADILCHLCTDPPNGRGMQLSQDSSLGGNSFKDLAVQIVGQWLGRGVENALDFIY
jgi:hypothetical protein